MAARARRSAIASTTRLSAQRKSRYSSASARTRALTTITVRQSGAVRRQQQEQRDRGLDRELARPRDRRRRPDVVEGERRVQQRDGEDERYAARRHSHTVSTRNEP